MYQYICKTASIVPLLLNSLYLHSLYPHSPYLHPLFPHSLYHFFLHPHISRREVCANIKDTQPSISHAYLVVTVTSGFFVPFARPCTVYPSISPG